MNAIRLKIEEIFQKNSFFFHFLTQCYIFITNKRRKRDYRAKIQKRIDFERNPIENKQIFQKNRIFSFFD